MTVAKTVERLIERLNRDDSWQHIWTDEQRAVIVNALGTLFKLRLCDGCDAEIEYARVLRMMKAAE